MRRSKGSRRKGIFLWNISKFYRKRNTDGGVAGKEMNLQRRTLQYNNLISFASFANEFLVNAFLG